MGKLLKYLLIAIVIGLWIYLVGRSCNTPKNIVESTTNSIGLTDTEGEAEAAIDESDLEDLYEVEESDVRDGNADNSNPDTDADSNSEDFSDNGEPTDDSETEDTDASDTDNEAAASASEDPIRSSTYSSTGSSTFGKYLVVTGSYLSEANGRVMAKKLRRMGYESAEVLSFDLSQYYSVTAGRYNDLGEARAAAKRIKGKGIEAYVHKMRGKKVRN